MIDGETIETTPEHPFYTLEAGWTDAADLKPGMHVPSEDGEPGTVEAVAFSGGPGIMYNLTVEVAHTFFVGEGRGLVHNCGGALSKGLRDAKGRFTGRDPSATLFSKVAEQKTWDAIAAKPGWPVTRSHVTVVRNGGRVYDGAATGPLRTLPNGRTVRHVIGLETKSNSAGTCQAR